MQIAPTIMFFRRTAFRALAYIGNKLFFVKLIAPQFTNPGPDAADWAIEIVLFPVLCYVPWRTEAARNWHAAVSALQHRQRKETLDCKCESGIGNSDDKRYFFN